MPDARPPVGDTPAAKCPAPECVDDGCTGQCEHWPAPVRPTQPQPTDVIERAKDALEGVTDGPWRIATNRHPECSGRSWGWIEGPRPHWTWSDDKRGHRADAQFIAAARSLVPELAAALADFVGAVAEIRALHYAADTSDRCTDSSLRCIGCGFGYPCPTIAALDKAGYSQNSADAAEPKQPPRP